MKTKSNIRKELIKNRNTLTKEEHQKYSKLIENRLFLSKQYKTAQTLLIYASYQKEVATYGIIKAALSSGKKVFCPKVLSSETMNFYPIFSLEDLIPGYKGIPEPPIRHTSYHIMNNSNPLIILPLVGFDEEKNRLGYGGGYYDRYLERFPDLESIGLAFECQKYGQIIPTEDTDAKPHFIITEKTIY